MEIIDIKGWDERPDCDCSVDVHWNAAGHRYVALRLLEKLAAMDVTFTVSARGS